MKKAGINWFVVFRTLSRRLACKFYWSVKYYGVDLTVLKIMLKLLSLLYGTTVANDWYKRVCSIRFDKRHGLDTKGTINPDKLDISTTRKKQAVMYTPTSSVTFALVLSELPIDYSPYVFVDYGSGKGRALSIAAHFPFMRILGVELSPKLCQICQNNINHLKRKQLKCQSIIIHCKDATTFELPQEPLVIYFFQPFKQEIFSIVLKNICRSLQQNFRHIIICAYPFDSRFMNLS